MMDAEGQASDKPPLSSSSSAAGSGPSNPAASEEVSDERNMADENPSNPIAAAADADFDDDSSSKDATPKPIMTAGAGAGSHTRDGDNIADASATSNMPLHNQFIPPALLQLTPEQRKLFVLAALGVVLVFPGAVKYLSSLLLRIGGTAIGIGLGLGLAAHIHDALDTMADRHSRDTAAAAAAAQRQQRQQTDKKGGGAAAVAGGTPRAGAAMDGQATSASSRRADLFDENSYTMLMASAGYDVPDGLLRGQILRTTTTTSTTESTAATNATNATQNAEIIAAGSGSEQQKRPITAATILENTVADGPNMGRVPNPLYPNSVPDAFSNFTSVPTPRGPSTLQRLYPSLPKNICNELGTFMDLIMRDFIHCWFCTIDPAVLYEDEKERRQRVQAERERQAKKAKMMEVLEEGRKAMAADATASGSAGSDAADAGENIGKENANADAVGAVTTTDTDAGVDEEHKANAMQQQQQRQQTQAQAQAHSAAQTNKHSLMVLSTAPLRPSPFPEALYATMATLFGSLAVNARDNVNIMELILVKIVRVLSLNIKTYRELRKFAVTKHRRRLASARGRVKKVRQSSSSARDASDGTSATNSGASAGIAELRSATSYDRLDTSAGLQRKASRGSLATPPGSGNGTFEDGMAPRERGQSFGASSTSGDNAALPSESEITEIAMIREYLLAGKLHRAITFGMDVPSLLFADPHGRDCPPPSMEEDDSDGANLPKGDSTTSTLAMGGMLEDDDVLYARLFSPKSQLLVESELDYCRVLSHRLIKETTTKVDFESPTLRSMAVEMVASCVLSPIMSCFSPEMINYGLIKVLEPYEQATSSAGTGSELEETKLTTMDSDMDLMRGWDQSGSGAELLPMEETQSTQHLGSDFGDVEEEAGALSLVETLDDVDAGSTSGDIDANELTRDKSCQNILTLLTMSLIALQEHLDFDEIRLSRESNTDVTVNWDAPTCRAAVRRLVLVVEAALLHGLRARREKKQSKQSKAIGSDDDKVFSGDSELDVSDGDVALLDDNEDEDEKPAEDAAHLHSTSIIVLLMELTENLDAFERRVMEEEGMSSSASLDDSEHSHDVESVDMHKTDWTTSLPPHEVSSLRTLIAAWLHTGQLFRTLSVFLQSRRTILRPFYHSCSFMRDIDAAAGFVRQLKVLDGVDILVDTAAVLRCRSLDLRGDLQLEAEDVAEEEIAHAIDDGASDSFFAADGLDPGNASGGDAEHPTAGTHGIGGSLVGGVRANLRSNRQRLSRLVTTDLANVASTLTGSSSLSASAAATTSSDNGKSPPTPLTAAVAAIHMQHQRQNFDAPHLTFSRNAAFAENLRKERDRRMASWAKVAAASHQNATVDMIVHTRGLTDRDVQIHRELHGLARAFYSGSVVLSISEKALSDAGGDGNGSRTPQISMENIANRRRFEVPDDDSSFLLRASSRRLTPLGVTRNARDHSQSFVSFLATYQVPILHPKSKRYKGGRYIRQVEIKFFPSDKTATVSPRKEDAPRHMHANLKAKRLSSTGSGHSLSSSKGSTGSASSSSFLSSEFQKTRHLCQRHIPAGSGNVLTASMNPSLMDSDDFVATPRVGKAYDFVYRYHLFEKPVVNIGGKQFTVQDSSLKGPHKADASALEISDATLSYALLTLGESVVADTDTDTLGLNEDFMADDGDSSASASKKTMSVGGIALQRGDEGSTMILMKIKTSRGTGDAGNGTDKGGTAPSSTMRPFRPSFLRAALLQTSTRQEAQLQCLLTCVKAGSARNATKARTEALLQPYLTLLEFAVSKKREKQSILLRDLKLGLNHIDIHQLRRNAILQPRYPTVLHSLSAVTVEGAIKARQSNDLIGSPAMVLYKIRVSAIVEVIGEDDPNKDSFYREEWVILRPFRDFVTLHKFLKKQVSENESSGNAGAKLVGAAAAALTFSTNQRQRRALMPSLGQASKAGALGVTQKSIEKRREILSAYLSYLTDPKHLLHQCPELMRFLGASEAFPQEIDPNAGPDSLGRIHLKRTPLSREVVLDDMMRLGLGVSHVNIVGALSENTDVLSRAAAVAVSPRGMSSPRLVPISKVGSAGDLSSSANVDGTSASSADRRSRSSSSGKEKKGSSSLQRARWASIKSQVEQVSLSEVRNGIFRFIRYLFDLENASFFRNRILSALKTMSFAVTSANEFHKLLFRMHLQQASAEAWAGWILFGREILWPDGVFFDSSPPQSPEELKAQEDQAKLLLMEMFPEQIKRALSEDIAKDGIAMLHEMLQNRVVLRSMSYMLMDEVYSSIFPGLNDVVTGCSAVDVQDDP